MTIIRSHLSPSSLLPLMVLVASTSASAAPESAAQSNDLSLLPMPRAVILRAGSLEIGDRFRVALTGFREPRLERAVGRLYARLRAQTGLRFPRSLTDTAWTPSLDDSADQPTPTLRIRVDGPGEEVQSVDANESYALEVTEHAALLSALTPVGALRGIETFLQLVQAQGNGFGVPALTIQDAPRFPWRGLLLDTGRMFLPLATLKRTLDGMAAVKLNVLHWHLTEDQGFRVESKVFPKLHQLGSDGSYYTQDEVREIIAYARDRGIRVMPELDIPGHSSSWLIGYPELASAPGPYRLVRTWGVKEPVMDPSKEEVYEFLDVLFGEMAALFDDAYFHIGGDEVNGVQWGASEAIETFMAEQGMADHRDLQAYFNQRVSVILAKYGKTMVGWDEIIHRELPKDTVVQSWRGHESLAEAARAILSNGYYIDLMHSAARHYAVEPMAGDAARLGPDEATRILGGEATMWGELATAENVESRIWPRTAAIAERLWSSAVVRDVDDMYRRLDETSRRLEWLGLTHRSNYRPMLQRLTGYRSIESLQAIADLLEPVKGYDRHRARAYSSCTSMNRLVDAVRPESRAARRFGQLIERYLNADAQQPDERRASGAAIRQRLAGWHQAAAGLQAELGSSFLLEEIWPLVSEVAAVTRVGLEAIDRLEGDSATEGWRRAQLEVLERGQAPRAELLIMIVPAVRRLVEAVDLRS